MLAVCAYSIICVSQFSCSDNKSSTFETKTQEDLTAETPSVIETNQALLTLNEMLAATDVKEGLAKAAQNNDIEALRTWAEHVVSGSR